VAALGRWLAVQRQANRGGRLRPARAAALTAAGVPLTVAQRGADRRAAAPTPAELADQYREGASLQQLAVEHHLSVTRVRGLVVAGGGTIRPAARMPTERLLEIQAWGASIPQIAAMVGLSPHSVWARVRRAQSEERYRKGNADSDTLNSFHDR
jgi:DNA-binding transcriptional ArsR family regulator